MRYLGNKESILPKIEELLNDKGLLLENLTFFDAFCGTGTVAEWFKDRYRIIINDNLKWSTVYARGRICVKNCSFDGLEFNPFEYFNESKETIEGFMYKNYSPGGSERMYFSAENAGRIDFFRKKIEEWKTLEKINEDEYNYLLACLIESVSDVSNTAGVYGAYLKKWDSRALKPIFFDKVDCKDVLNRELQVYNKKIEEIVSEVDCDILYLDPPYTQNQYGTQYHLLETLILDDNPSISKVTGSRKTAPMRSDWSKNYKVHILFDKVIAETRAKYIVFSYNNDGFMTKEFIEACLKRYGKEETYACQKISYKKYQNWKSENKKEHYEYLFFIEKKESSQVVYESPLNYIGSKGRIVKLIRDKLPDNYDNFYDVFGGGFNVGINVEADKVVYNDINYFVKELIESFAKYDTYEYILYMKKMETKFGLEKNNSEGYLKARTYYNSQAIGKRDPRLLLIIILYGFQQQIRFNSNHEFNNPVGMRWFNDKILEKLISFSRKLKCGRYIFMESDYINILSRVREDDFVYLDPPYKLTTGAYNDGKRGFKGWDTSLEQELFNQLDIINQKGVKFMLSYVQEHNGELNHELIKWIEEKNYSVIGLGNILGISGTRRKEILIINYIK